jgi:RND family efflux transporter MFP subunit
MNVSETLKLWLGRKSVRGALLIIVLIAVYGLLNSGDEAPVVAEEVKQTVVETTTAKSYTDDQSLSLIGSVRAFSEAKITSEKAGRVVSVNVNLGQQVQAGAVIGTLENASERASVLQAEGAYDAAVAASAQNGIGVGEAATNLTRAQNTALTSLKSAFNTINNAVVSDIDVYYNQPQTPAPRLTIAGKGNTRSLEMQRVALETSLADWKILVDSLTTDSNLLSAIDTSEANINSVLNMVDTFLTIFREDENMSRTNDFTNLRSSIINTLSSLDSSKTGLESAFDTVRRAELAASGGTTSASDAQVKQALGSLRAAQANLAKTILRSPISGAVNSLSIRQGDFINSFTEVAIVANNSALEIVTFVSDEELPLISVGDEVIIENKYTGVITQIAPAVDVDTRKTEVRIAAQETTIANGDTVKITKNIELDETLEMAIQVPLTAVKFAREDGSIFVVEDGMIKARPVTLGNVLGNSVEIIAGLDFDTEFVVDARGLTEGEAVQIQN